MLKPKHKKEGRQTFQWSFILMNKNTEARPLPETTLEGVCSSKHQDRKTFFSNFIPPLRIINSKFLQEKRKLSVLSFIIVYFTLY